MKTILTTIFTSFCCLSISLAAVSPRPLDIQNGDIEKIKDAGSTAIQKVLADFVQKRGGESLKSFVILPLKEDIDDGYFTEKYQSMLADQGRSAGYKIYTREDADIGRLLDEIKWGEDYGDAMDQATIQKFGNIKGVQAVIVPRMSVSNINGTITVRASLKGNEVETFANLPGCGEASVVIAPFVPEKSIWEKIVEQSIAFKAIIIVLSILLPIFYFIIKAFRNAGRPR